MTVVSGHGARGIPVDDETRRRILGTTDLELLSRWIRRASGAESAAEVLDED